MQALCQSSEVRSQKSEVRSQKSEVRSQKSEVRSQTKSAKYYSPPLATRYSLLALCHPLSHVLKCLAAEQTVASAGTRWSVHLSQTPSETPKIIFTYHAVILSAAGN